MASVHSAGPQPSYAQKYKAEAIQMRRVIWFLVQEGLLGEVISQDPFHCAQPFRHSENSVAWLNYYTSTFTDSRSRSHSRDSDFTSILIAKLWH